MKKLCLARTPLTALAFVSALLFSATLNAQVLAPPANRDGSVNYSSTAVPATGLWDPVAAATQMQGAFDYENTLTTQAINTVTSVLTTSDTQLANANNALSSAENSYTNSVNVYNAVNTIYNNSSGALNSANNANNYSAAAANVANSAYNTVASTPARASSAPHVISNFGCSGGSLVVYFADGTTQSGSSGGMC